MVLQNSGPIKLSDLAAQFGQTAAAGQNLKLSEYCRGGAYGVLAAVGANAAAPNVPSNNYNIKMSDFYGAYKIKTPVLNTIPTLTGTNTSANVTFLMASYLVSSSNYGTVTWTMTGNPTGVTINSSTGVITATAGTRVNNSVTVTATGPGAIPVSKTFTMMTTTKIIPWFTGVNNAFVYAVIPGGQFNTEKLAVTFTKLYGMYFLNDVQQFTIEWTFTDGTNSFDSFFNKANTTNYGATYTFNVFNASGGLIFTSDSSVRKWCFSNSLNYATFANRVYVSQDDGIWGAAIQGNLDGNSPGPGLQINTGWGIQNYDSADTAYSGLFNNSVTITSASSAAVKSAYDSAVSASNQTYGIGSLDSNGDILLRGNLRISKTANIYKGTEVFSSGGMNIDEYSWNYLANYVIPRRVYPQPLTNTESAYLFTGAAQDHSAYVRNGELFVYGRNDYGQLGLGHTSNTITVPTKVPGINNASLVACGDGFTLCVRTDGTAISTGLNDNGQLGIGSDANGQLGRGASSANVVINSNIVPMLMPDGSNVPARSISAGGYHSAVLLNNGSAYLCGKNDQGQCGASTTLVPHANSLGIIPSLSNVVDVACGHEHTLFTCYDGQVLGVGRNDRGQLGQGNKTSPVTLVVQVLAGGGAGSKNGLSVEIAAGFNHSAFIKNDSTIFVFGANDKGQLGLGETTTESLTLTQLVGYAGYDIACGRNHTVILTTPDPLVFNFTGNNALIAFGDNAYGQIAAGTSHAASIDGSGSIITCGLNGYGRLGNNTTSTETVSNLFVNFTGQHRCFVDALAPARLRDHEGLVVVTDKNAYASGLLRGRRAMTINQALPLVSLSKVPKDPRAFGVISLTQDHPAGPSAAISGTELLKIAEQGDVRVQINSIGEGCIWVCDKTGSTIHAGDYVTTSSLSGYASLQVLDDGDVPDGTLRNYTVAKLTMDCDFSQPLVDVEEVQKDEYGNVVFDADGSLVYTIVTTTQGPSVEDPVTGETRTGEPLETPIPVTEPSYEMRWMTTEIDASSGVSITTLISKEDYEKQLGTVTKKFAKLYATDIYGTSATFNTLGGTAISSIVTSTSSNVAASSAAVKSAYDSAVSASNQTYGIGSLDSNGDILLRGNLRISKTANIYKGTEVFSSGGMNIDEYSWNYLANYVIPRRVYPQPLTNTESAYLFTGAAQDHSAYVRNGELFVYGRNDYGQLGLGHTSNTITVPTKVPGINNASLVACGDGFTLCVRTDGTAISTGLNDNGQLGIANVVINSNIVPMLMPDGSNVPARSISAGGYHSAVLLNNGSAYLCGKNDQGQCGASTTLVPHANSLGIIPSLSNVVDVACGHEHTLFTCYDGQVLGVGRNDRGQLGQGNKTSPVTLVVQVLAGGGAGSKNGLSVEIAAGFNHSAFIKNDSTIFVFGANDKGQLGLGETTTESLTPTQLVGYAGYNIACGRNHTVISTTPDPLVFNFTGNNALIAFGDNAYGQVGDNSPNVTTRWFPNRIHDGAFKKKLYVETVSNLFVNFTGQHRCFVDALAPARLRDHEGLVVVTDKNAYASGLLRGRRAMTINQALPLVSLSKVPKDPRAFGVISLTQDHPAGPSAAISGTELLKIAE
eukprot:gene32818-biopygen14031